MANNNKSNVHSQPYKSCGKRYSSQCMYTLEFFSLFEIAFTLQICFAHWSVWLLFVLLPENQGWKYNDEDTTWSVFEGKTLNMTFVGYVYNYCLYVCTSN